MPYDEGLAQRVREYLQDRDGIVEQKMFGGLSFMLDGNMAVGVLHEDLVVRAPQRDYETMLALPGARKMDFTGKSLEGWVYVGRDGTDFEDDLAAWIESGVEFAESLPPK